VKAEHKKAHVTTQSVLKSEFKKSKTVTTLFSKCKGVLRSDVESDIAFYSLASPGHLYVEVDLVESGRQHLLCRWQLLHYFWHSFRLARAQNPEP